MLSDALTNLSARSARRDELMRHGATGAINQLTLNAMRHFGEVAETLRRFRGESRFRLPDDTHIAMSDGRVGAANGSENDFVWEPDAIYVSTAVELLRDPATAAGRPATELIDHPFLSPDMGVLKAEWSPDHTGKRWLNIDLAMPWRLFCSTSGNVWDACEAEAESDTTNVVPFGRRWA